MRKYVDTVGTLDPEFLKPLLNCVLGELGVVLDEFQIVRRQLLAWKGIQIDIPFTETPVTVTQYGVMVCG